MSTAALVVLVCAGCGGGSDDSTTTRPDITLTSTSTTAPLFDEVGTTAEPATDTAGGTTTDTPTDDTATPTTEQPGATDTDSSTTAPPGTVAATTVDPPTASTTAPVTATQFELRTDGLGAVLFGAEPEGVISFVSSFIGPPTGDTGWVDPFTIGPCAGTEIRQVMWGVLTLEFGDASNVAEGRRHFYAYYYGVGGVDPADPAGLATPEGLTLGSTVADLLRFYPDAELRSADEFIDANFLVNDDLRGLLTGLADDDTVTLVTGGLPCDG